MTKLTRELLLKLAEQPVIRLAINEYSANDFLTIFLVATRNWDGDYIEKEFELSASSAEALNSYLAGVRVQLSRFKNSRKLEGKSFKEFKFSVVSSELIEGNPATEEDRVNLDSLVDISRLPKFKVILAKKTTPNQSLLNTLDIL